MIGLMDVAALVISILSLIGAVVGTFLANKRAKEAMALSRRAVADSRWSAAQEAVQRLIGFDPAAEPVGERLANLRIAFVALIDDLPDWTGLGSWLASEQVLGATLGREVIELSKPSDGVEKRLQNLELLSGWAQALSSNLRYLRSNGLDVEAMTKLQENAVGLTREIHEKHGWGLPATAYPYIRPLDD